MWDKFTCFSVECLKNVYVSYLSEITITRILTAHSHSVTLSHSSLFTPSQLTLRTLLLFTHFLTPHPLTAHPLTPHPLTAHPLTPHPLTAHPLTAHHLTPHLLTPHPSPHTPSPHTPRPTKQCQADQHRAGEGQAQHRGEPAGTAVPAAEEHSGESRGGTLEDTGPHQ